MRPFLSKWHHQWDESQNENQNRGQAYDLAILERWLPRSFNNTTVASDRESQIASLTPTLPTRFDSSL